jgi:hypothetical protein
MNNGLKIILERMKTNPEEFALGDGYSFGGRRWSVLIQQYWEMLTEEEMTEYKRAMREINLEEFEKDVLRELMRDEVGGSIVTSYEEAARLAQERLARQSHISDPITLVAPVKLRVQNNTQEER